MTRRLCIALVLVASSAWGQVIDYNAPRQFGGALSAVDFSPNSNDGTIVGGVTGSTNAPVSGWASAEFDGTSGRLDILDSPVLTPSPNMTISAWIYPRKGNIEIASKRSTFNTDNSFSFRVNADRNIFWNEGTSGGGAGPAVTFTSAVIATSTWTHVALSKSGTNVSLYIDGVLTESSGALNDFMYDSASKMMIGAVNASSPALLWDGKITEVRIWSYAKTDFSDRTIRLIGTEAGLVGYWPLDGEIIE